MTRFAHLLAALLPLAAAGPALAQDADFNLTYHVERTPAAQLDIDTCGATAGKAAEQAGLRGTTQGGDGLVLGDIILAVNGRKVTDYDSLRDEVERYQVGETVALTLLRDDATAEVNVRLEALQ